MTKRSLGVAVVGACVLVLLSVQSPVMSAGDQQAASAASAITYAKHVAPLMQRSCVTCHRPGTNAPMSLMTYEDVRPWARAIKARVSARIMPPWHIERNVGIQKFKDDPSLSDE